MWFSLSMSNTEGFLITLDRSNISAASSREKISRSSPGDHPSRARKLNTESGM